MFNKTVRPDLLHHTERWDTVKRNGHTSCTATTLTWTYRSPNFLLHRLSVPPLTHSRFCTLHNEELTDLNPSPNIVRVVKSRRMRWAGHVARMGEGRGVHRVLVGKPKWKRTLERPRRRWEDNINPLTPNDGYSGRTAPLTSKRCILYIYSTNIGTEYFKRGIYCPFFSLQNAVCSIILMYLVPVLFKFYIQGVLKLKKNNSGAKSLI